MTPLADIGFMVLFAPAGALALIGLLFMVLILPHALARGWKGHVLAITIQVYILCALGLIFGNTP